MRNELLKVADRLAAADGPDRDMNVEIAQALGLSVGYAGTGMIPFDEETGNPLPNWVFSLDDAFTLVPEGLSASATRQGNLRGAAEIWRWVPEKYAEMYGGPEELRRRNGSFAHQNVGAATPALALCIAALRARAA